MILRDGVFVTGTDTGIGKTVVSAALGLAAQASGRTAVVLKPGQTGDDGTITGDAEFCQMVLGTDEPLDAISPIRLRAPLAPAVAARLEAARVDPDLVRERHAALRTRYDLVIVEGAGGLLVPFADGVDMAGLAAMLGLPLIVVARPGLGTLNHILLTLEAAHRRGLTVLGVVLSGFPDDPGIDVLTNPAALARLTPVPLLGVIPYDPAIDTEAGNPGDLARIGPAGLDPLLGGTFSRERFRRDIERRLAAVH
ncbi:MAG TPA: dethiobiotin synthase [Miltoncostaeaceae bacterium]|nr:dethiobiotin synthase [Miltoncostaeaceae bacterium]